MGILVNALEEIGAQAVCGTKRTPYSIEQTEMRLNEMAVAIGAPMKPSPKGLGPHTVRGSPVSQVLLPDPMKCETHPRYSSG